MISLEKLTLGESELTGTIWAGIPKKDGQILTLEPRVDVTIAFTRIFKDRIASMTDAELAVLGLQRVKQIGGAE